VLVGSGYLISSGLQIAPCSLPAFDEARWYGSQTSHWSPSASSFPSRSHGAGACPAYPTVLRTRWLVCVDHRYMQQFNIPEIGWRNPSHVPYPRAVFVGDYAVEGHIKTTYQTRLWIYTFCHIPELHTDYCRWQNLFPQPMQEASFVSSG
jgi:hypothetical protein